MINKKQKGFTMVEMITVLAIFGMVSSVVLFNYGKFRSDTILTNMAYEVALSIREAQIYGVGARSADGNTTTLDFSTPYGIYLKEGLGQYQLFGDTDGSPPDKEFTSCDPGSDTCVTTYNLQRGVIVNSLELSTDSTTCTDIASDELSVVFERPNPEPRANTDRTYSFALIDLKSTEDVHKYVAVYSNGQIAVLGTKPCN